MVLNFILGANNEVVFVGDVDVAKADGNEVLSCDSTEIPTDEGMLYYIDRRFVVRPFEPIVQPDTPERTIEERVEELEEFPALLTDALTEGVNSI